MFSRVLQRWEISASTGSHFDVLDGLRGVAILLVVACHTFYTDPSRGFFSRLAEDVIMSGWMGVPVFFVLSGFLISYSFFQKRESDPSYWHQPGYVWRRLGKILPPFYLSIILFLVFFWFVDGSFYWQPALIWATGMGNFISENPPFNQYYWSLIVESHFYIVLPILIWAFRGLPTRPLAIVIFLILFFVPLIARWLTWPMGVYSFPFSDSHMMLLFKRFPTHLDYFAWGVLMAGIFVGLKPVLDKLKPLSVIGYAGAAILVLSLVFWGAWEREYNIQSQPTRLSEELRHFLPAVATFLLMFFIFDPQSLGNRILSFSWLRFTGIISYEWYLFHPPICHWFHTHFGPTHGSLAAYALRVFVPVVITFIFAALVYRYFSLPILNRIRDRVKSSPA